jgi:hypothetical protein
MNHSDQNDGGFESYFHSSGQYILIDLNQSTMLPGFKTSFSWDIDTREQVISSELQRGV